MSVIAVVGACGSDSGTDETGEGGASPDTDSTGAFTTSSGSGQNVEGCADDAKSVYLLGKDRELVRFDPGELSFSTIGHVACPVSGGPAVGIPTPFSMAVDRTGIAWVLYSDGTLYNVDVATGSCKSTDFIPNQLEAFQLFGMGFVTNDSSSSKETLFLSSYSPGDGIGKLDFSDLAVRRVGFYDKKPGAAELTGTGDARLYGFFTTNPTRVARIDKDDADIVESYELPTIEIGAAWAFAFWGGSFWLFTAPDGTHSHLDRLDPNTGVVETLMDDVGLQVVGAGVSTCAPVEAPK